MASQLAYYLMIDGIRGDVVTKPYDGWIELESFNFKGDNPLSGNSATGQGAGKPDQSITIFIFDGKATPAILLASASGKHYKEAILAVKKGNAEVLRINMNNVYFPSFQPGTRDLPKTERPVDMVQIEFEEMIIQYGSLVIVQSMAKSRQGGLVRAR